MWKNKLLLLVLIGIVLFYNSAFAQLSPYQGIINPYERYGGLGGSFGGVIIAEPDAVPSPLDNPAGIAWQRRTQVFAGMNFEMTKYEHEYHYKHLTETESEESELNPGIVAASYPFNLLHRDAAVAISLAKIPAPEFEAGYVTKIDSYPDMNHERNGNVGTATIGFSMKITPTFSIGLSYTRWLGSWKWEDMEIIRPHAIEVNKFGKGEFVYDGNFINIGITKKINRFSIGALWQSPFTLMHAKENIIYEWGYYQTFDIEQQYKGAAAIGVSWHLFDCARLGLGYRFQNDMKLSFTEDPDYCKPSKQLIHKLSIAGEYTLHCHDIKIPVSLAYQRTWQEGFTNYYPDYIRLEVTDDQRINGSLQMGVNCYYKSLGLHLGARWLNYTLYAYNELFGAPSSELTLTSRYNVQKTYTIIDFGLSYFIK